MLRHKAAVRRPRRTGGRAQRHAGCLSRPASDRRLGRWEFKPT